MMVMRRREGEKILIGDDIVIHIAHIGRNKVKIAIDAPRQIAIVAEEVKMVREANLAAAFSLDATSLDVTLLHRRIFPHKSSIRSGM